VTDHVTLSKTEGGYEMIAVCEVPEPGTVDLLEDGLFFPVPSVEPNQVLLEDRDGNDTFLIPAKGTTVKRGGKTIAAMSDVHITMFVTGARVAFACSKYDKGGGWIGGPSALVLNAGSKALAAMRRRGKMAVGHVRYPWISAVGSTTKMGFLSEECLYFRVKTTEGNTDLLLHLPKNVDAAGLAAEIARRAATYRLACESGPAEDELAALQGLALAQRREPVKDKVLYHVFPTFWPISEKSARMLPL
jgi:hypothetical protein